MAGATTAAGGCRSFDSHGLHGFDGGFHRFDRFDDRSLYRLVLGV